MFSFTCSNTKSHIVDLGDINNLDAEYKSDGLVSKLVIDFEGTSTINGVEIQHFPIQAKKTGVIQFIEPVNSGHFVFYTLHLDTLVLTTHKSYNFMGPVSVNVIQQCARN